MIILLDTSTPVCKLTLMNGDWRYDNEWQAGRELAKGLLSYLKEQLVHHDKQFNDITGIGVFEGPGSFTGLRIGTTVLNTIADAQNIPIVGAVGDDWQQNAIRRLTGGENDHLVLPAYGGEANITKPRK